MRLTARRRGDQASAASMGRSLTVARSAGVARRPRSGPSQHGARPGVRRADHGQGDRAIPAGRERGRRDEADALALGLQSASRAPGMPARWLEPEPPEELVDVPQRVDPGDRLLAEIAALHEVDRPGVAADLLGQVLLGDVACRRPACRPRSAGPRSSRGRARPAPAARPSAPEPPATCAARPRGRRSASSPAGPWAIRGRRSTGSPPSSRGTCAQLDRSGTTRRRPTDQLLRPRARPGGTRTSNRDRSSTTMSSKTPYFWKMGQGQHQPPGSVATRIESAAGQERHVASVFPWGLVTKPRSPGPPASRLTSLVVRLCRNLARSGPATSSRTRSERSVTPAYFTIARSWLDSVIRIVSRKSILDLHALW